MKPTNAEKLILLMLVDLHEKLGIESKLSPSDLPTLLEHDVTWRALNSYGVIGASAEVQEVTSVLNMWEKIERCWEKLNPSDRAEVLARCPHIDRAPKFPGFSWFDDTNYADIAYELRQQGKISSHYGPRGMEDAPEGISSSYKGMISAYAAVVAEVHEGWIGKDELCAILNAYVPPRQFKTLDIDYDEPDYFPPDFG